MRKMAYIVSVKYAAGSHKEFVLMGKKLKEHGIEVRYLLSSRYRWMHKEPPDETFFITDSSNLRTMLTDSAGFLLWRWTGLLSLLKKQRPDFLCFYNAHPLNPLIARLIKRNFPQAITALYLHDPYKPDKSSYGFKKSIYIKLVEVIQKLTVRYMDYVISPSEYSSYLCKKYYPWFNGQNHIAPLLIQDQWLNVNTGRRYFSIIGGANPATGHDTFIEVVNYAAQKDIDCEFALISSSNISKYIKNLTEKGRRKVKIINKDTITDSEINEVIRESHAVFRLDKEVTQSGVLPLAYMNKTPIIARDIQGLTQHVKHKKNGYIVPLDCSVDDLVDAMEFIKDNFERMSKNARKSYEEKWSGQNWDSYYSWLTLLLKEK